MAGYERKIVKLLKEAGFSLDRRPRGSHDIWSDGEIEVSVPKKIRKRHTANGLLKQAGISTKIG